MCGRFALYTPPEAMAEYFSATLNYRYDLSYNIAPTLKVAVLIAIDQERFIVPMRWGLIPSWHKEGEKLSVLNNAKIETVDTKPSFRASFKRHRCIVIADGFYEWDSDQKPKQPYFFHNKKNQPIALAGIWDRWTTEKHSIESCCIITEESNEAVRKIHHRMPSMIAAEKIDEWLDVSQQDTSKAKSIAADMSAYEDVVYYPVTPKMNRVVYDDADCIKELSF